MVAQNRMWHKRTHSDHLRPHALTATGTLLVHKSQAGNTDASERVKPGTASKMTLAAAIPLLDRPPRTTEADWLVRSGGPCVWRGGGRAEVLAKRIRQAGGTRHLWVWQVADSFRKGAATNAAQIAELLYEREWLDARGTQAWKGRRCQRFGSYSAWMGLDACLAQSWAAGATAASGTRLRVA